MGIDKGDRLEKLLVKLSFRLPVPQSSYGTFLRTRNVNYFKVKVDRENHLDKLSF